MASGGADVAPAFYLTPEREEAIDFSLGLLEDLTTININLESTRKLDTAYISVFSWDLWVALAGILV